MNSLFEGVSLFGGYKKKKKTFWISKLHSNQIVNAGNKEIL